MWGLAEQILNCLVNLSAVTHPFWGLGITASFCRVIHLYLYFALHGEIQGCFTMTWLKLALSVSSLKSLAKSLPK